MEVFLGGIYGIVAWIAVDWTEANIGRPAAWALGIAIIGGCLLVMNRSRTHV